MGRVSVALIAIPAFLGFTLSAQAQLPEVVQRSSSPSGIRIQGDAAVRAPAEHATPVAAGADRDSANTARAITGSGSVKIQGNTRIDARGRDLNAITKGRDNKADNAVGSIGEK